MSLSFLRPLFLGALIAATLAACGGKAEFDISGTVVNQKYPGLTLVETESNQTLTINDITQTRFSFANSIDYGTPYNVIVRTTPTSGNPPHQTCSFVAGSPKDTAGRQASINMTINCIMTPHTVLGTISLATGSTGSYVGLQIINGSNSATPVTITDMIQNSYSFQGLTFQMPYGISIFHQPTDTTIKCKLVPKLATPGATDDKVAGIMADVDVEINIVCSKVPAP